MEKLQQFFFEYFGDRDWDEYTLREHHFLKRNIGFALFGSPSQVGDDSRDTGYKENQVEQIDEIYELIKLHHYIEDKDLIQIRIIFIIGTMKTEKKEQFQVPLIVLKKCKCNVFIDNSGRVYKSWKQYLNKNKLPKCEMCCPLNGKYQGKIIKEFIDETGKKDGEVEVMLEYHESPACSIGQEILNGADKVGTVASVGTSATLLAGLLPGVTLFPPLAIGAAVVGGAVGLYTVGRSIANLVDRNEHEQSISLTNSEARADWLGASCGVLGVAAAGANGVLGQVVSRGVRVNDAVKVAVNTLNVSTLCFSLTATINSGYEMYQKLMNNESVSPLEVFQFSASVLFLCNSTVNFRTAQNIINESQATAISQYEDTLRSNRHRKIFTKARKEAERVYGREAGRAEVISGMRNIHDPDNFFAGLVKMNKNFNKAKVRFTITAEGQVKLNSNYVIDPNEFSSVNTANRNIIFSNLPPPAASMPQDTFNSYNSFITSSLQRIEQSATPLIAKFIKDITTDIIQNGDIASFTFIFNKLPEICITGLLNIFLRFMQVLSEEIKANLREIFPFKISLNPEILTFIKTLVLEMSKATNLPLNDYLEICFDIKGNVMDWIIDTLVAELRLWIEKKHRQICDQPIIQAFITEKSEKTCTECSENYFETVIKS